MCRAGHVTPHDHLQPALPPHATSTCTMLSRQAVRNAWADYFAARGVRYAFWSAYAATEAQVCHSCVNWSRVRSQLPLWCLAPWSWTREPTAGVASTPPPPQHTVQHCSHCTCLSLVCRHGRGMMLYQWAWQLPLLKTRSVISASFWAVLLPAAGASAHVCCLWTSCWSCWRRRRGTPSTQPTSMILAGKNAQCTLPPLHERQAPGVMTRHVTRSAFSGSCLMFPALPTTEGACSSRSAPSVCHCSALTSTTPTRSDPS